LEPVRALVKPTSEGLFAGVLDFSKLPFNLNTLGMRLAALLGIFPPGDHRDWDAIYSWADSLSAELGCGLYSRAAVSSPETHNADYPMGGSGHHHA
jgi:hypothetical protein